MNFFLSFQATIQQYRTVLTYPGDTVITEKGETRDPNDLYTWKISGEFTNGTNILGLVFFAGNKKKFRFLFDLEHSVLMKI